MSISILFDRKHKHLIILIFYLFLGALSSQHNGTLFVHKVQAENTKYSSSSRNSATPTDTSHASKKSIIDQQPNNPEFDQHNVILNEEDIFLESMEDLHHVTYLSMLNYNITDKGLLESSALITIGNAVGAHKQHQKTLPPVSIESEIDNKIRLALMLESFILHLRNGHLERVPLEDLRAMVENLNITQIHERLREARSSNQIRNNKSINILSDKLIFGNGRNTLEIKQSNSDTMQRQQQQKSSQSTTIERCNYLLALYKYELSQSQNYNLMDSQQQNESSDMEKRSFNANSNDLSNGSIEREQKVPQQTFEMKNASIIGELDTGNEFDNNRMMGLCRLVVDCLSADELVKVISGPWIDNSQGEELQSQQRQTNSSTIESGVNERLVSIDEGRINSIVKAKLDQSSRSKSDASSNSNKNLDSTFRSSDSKMMTSSSGNKQQTIRTLRESLSKSIAKLCPLILFQLHDNEETCTFRREDRPSMLTVWGFATLFVTIVSFCSLIGLSITPFIGGGQSSGSSINDLTTESSDQSESMVMKMHNQKHQNLSNVSPVVYHQAQYHKASLTLFEGLAVGSLVGSALFSLIPQAFELQERESNDRFLLKAFIIFSGIYLFFCSERIMRIILDTRQKQKRQLRLNHRSSNSIQPIHASGTTTTALIEANNISNTINISNDISDNIIGQNVTHQQRSQPWYRYLQGSGKPNIHLQPLTNYLSLRPTAAAATTTATTMNVHKTFSRTVNTANEDDDVIFQEYNHEDSRFEGQFEEKNRAHKLSTSTANNAQLPLSDKNTRKLIIIDSDKTQQHRHSQQQQQQHHHHQQHQQRRRRRRSRKLHRRRREARKTSKATAAKANANISTNYNKHLVSRPSSSSNNSATTMIDNSVGQSEIGSIKKSLVRDRDQLPLSNMLVIRKTRDQVLARKQRDRNKLLRQQSLRRAIQDDDYCEQSDNDEEYYQLNSLDFSLSDDNSLTISSAGPSLSSSSSSSGGSPSRTSSHSSLSLSSSSLSLSSSTSATSSLKKRLSHRKRLRRHQQQQQHRVAFKPQHQQQIATCSNSAVESDARLTSSTGIAAVNNKREAGISDSKSFVMSSSHIGSDNPIELKEAVSRQISEIVQLNQIYKSNKRSRYDRDANVLTPNYVSRQTPDANVPAAGTGTSLDAAIYQPMSPGSRLTFGQPVISGSSFQTTAQQTYYAQHYDRRGHVDRTFQSDNQNRLDERAKHFINNNSNTCASGGAGAGAGASAGGYIPRDISTVAWMIVLGDGLHNFIDGISIGAAFSESILSGVSISVAVICEEFPHELGDFAVLVSSGMTVRQALGYNFLSACTCYFGMAIGIVLGDVNDAASYISALAAGVFLYIALVDMMGELSATLEETSRDSMARTLKLLLLQNVGIFVGISIIFVLSFIDF